MKRTYEVTLGQLLMGAAIIIVVNIIIGLIRGATTGG